MSMQEGTLCLTPLLLCLTLETAGSCKIITLIILEEKKNTFFKKFSILESLNFSESVEDLVADVSYYLEDLVCQTLSSLLPQP